MSALVSVLLPVRDGAEWLAEAIDSILRQTHRELELLVLDDGCRDASLEIAASFRDSRVRIDEHPEPAGRAARLNDGIDLAEGPFLARMDADDIARPERFARQVAALERDPNVGVLGTRMRTFGYGPRRTWRPPTAHDDIAGELLYHAPIAHPTVMARADALSTAGVRYDADLTGAEDWELWLRARHDVRLANLDETLLDYRTRPPAVVVVDHGPRQDNYRVVARRLLAELGLDGTDEEVERHRRIGQRLFLDGDDGIDEAESWLATLLARNDDLGVYPRAPFRRATGLWWYWACYAQVGTIGGRRAWRRHRASPLAAATPASPALLARFAARSAISAGRAARRPRRAG